MFRLSALSYATPLRWQLHIRLFREHRATLAQMIDRDRCRTFGGWCDQKMYRPTWWKLGSVRSGQGDLISIPVEPRTVHCTCVVEIWSSDVKLWQIKYRIGSRMENCQEAPGCQVIGGGFDRCRKPGFPGLGKQKVLHTVAVSWDQPKVVSLLKEFVAAILL